MATYQADNFSTIPTKHGRHERFIVTTYTLTAALALNDVIQMCQLPPNATVFFTQLSSTDLDTNGSPTIVLDVGDGDDTDRFIDGSTVGQTGGTQVNNTVAPYRTYTAEDTIDVLVQAAPATGATSGTIKLVVGYTFDPS